MSKSEDFLSFDKALRQLQLRSEELKKLVSEGEIRAYRDGESMKFRAEDIESLGAQSEGDTQLSFADSLEDDTGMVTEQISDEDTLLAEDDIDEEAPRRPARTAARPARVTAAATASDEPSTPGWVTAFAVIGALLMIWGMGVINSVRAEKAPGVTMFTSLWAKK